MKAIVCHAYGPPRTLNLEELPAPVPAAQEVLVDVGAVSVNFPDALIVANRYQISVDPPFTPGSDFAGTVCGVGAAVSGLAPGDRVFGSVFTGAYAEKLAVPAAGLQRIPDCVDFAQAAAFPTAYSTAYDAVRTTAAIEPGQTLVVLGAAGGVGSAAVQIGKLLGARVIACASSEPKVAVARSIGADEGVVYGVEPLKERLKELTGGGADAVIDPVGGAYAEEALRATRYGGRYVVIGFASGQIPSIPLNLVLLKGVIVKGYEIASFLTREAAAAERNRAEMRAYLEAGRLRPYIGGRYPLDRAGEAMARVLDRRAVGKIVIEP
ncbi:MAG: NADPH:quinone oxidoreductase family protein [Candidatus Binatia bacterium]|nr:NADPH:quinone oxidoreductase family protein [Candidatus Binatia bacterium]